MPQFPHLWEIEKQLWTGPADDYDKLMAENCVMVFPLPAGILSREAIIETVKMAPRWDDGPHHSLHGHQDGRQTFLTSRSL